MKDVLSIASPFTLWLASFSAIYGLQGAICSGLWAVNAQEGRLIIITAAVAALSAQIILLAALRARSLSAPSPFTQRVSLTLAVAALVAAAWTLIPIATTSMCI